ncbi:MAG: hypothetical protein AAFO95_06400 [Cyanobacteria bacterium J06600_6]
MTEEQILNAIANACKDDTLRFQIIIQDSVLYVYINRPADKELDYPSLETRIQEAIHQIKASEFEEIALYSRVLGEIEPDWQSLPKTELSRIDSGKISAMMSAITDAVKATNSIVNRIEQELSVPESLVSGVLNDAEELPTTADDQNPKLDLEALKSIGDAVWKLELKKYCFIRNQRLLYAVLAPPKENIAQLIDIFHLFGEPIQRSQMPILEEYFESSTMPSLDEFESEIQSWWTAIMMLDSDQKRQFSIWLSRYCIHPEQTTRTVEEVLQPQTEVKNELDPAAENQAASLKKESIQSNSQPKSSLIVNLKTMLRRLWSDR